MLIARRPDVICAREHVMGIEDFDIPEQLTGKARKAAEVIRSFILEELHERASGGGCRLFRSPEEWKARGEKYGQESMLILCYDGGDAGPFFDYDAAVNVFGFGRQAYDWIEEMNKRLGRIGLYAEPCTRWYGAVYVLP